LKLIILDRDGVINEDSDNYIKSADEWVPIPGSIEAIADLSKAGYTVVVATNQSGLNRGLFSPDDLSAMHNKLCGLVESAGGKIDGIYYCPHRPEELCICRKPNTGLLDNIASEWGSIEGIPFVGDSLKDLQVAEKMNCQGILVRTGKGQKTEYQLKQQPDSTLSEVSIFSNLNAVVQSILTESTH